VTSSSSSPAASPSVSPASEAQLAKIVLQPADFPAGWQHTPYQSDPGDAATEAAADAENAKCLGVPNSNLDKVAEANSDDFAQGDAQISSSADSYRSQSAVDADIAGLHNSKASTCFEQQFTKLFASSGVLPAGATFESVSVKITPGSAAGPANVVATGTGTAKITVSGTPVVVYFSRAFIAGPLIEAGVDAFSPGTPVPASVMDPLVAAVANRAAHP
jgi:hypothetical protein